MMHGAVALAQVETLDKVPVYPGRTTDRLLHNGQKINQDCKRLVFLAKLGNSIKQ